ncbi:hypothetical protein RSAG8_10688, partial [Rhizoctonia solani AG-8 WAC10335]
MIRARICCSLCSPRGRYIIAAGEIGSLGIVSGWAVGTGGSYGDGQLMTIAYLTI